MTNEPEPAKQLEEALIPIIDTDPETGIDDLQPLQDVFKDKSVIGLGEATHGTREFFQIKSRIIRFLVTELDVRIVGFESNFAAALAVNNYIVHGEGTATDAIDEIFNIYGTEEVLALIEWLREFNRDRSPEDRVRFYGFDVQATTGSAAALQSYLQTVDPEYAAKVVDALDNVKGLRYADDGIEAKLETLAELVGDLEDRFEQRGDTYAAQTSERDQNLARHHVWLLDRAREFRLAMEEQRIDSASVREGGMAGNVEWMLEHEDRDQIVLWGHNGHITRNDGKQPRQTSYRVMGSYLSERFGNNYYALGFNFGRGSFQAKPASASGDAELQECSVEGFDTDSVDVDALIEYFSKPDYVTAIDFENFAYIGLHDVLDEIEQPIFLLDFERMSTDPAVQDWLDRPHLLYGIGNVFDETARDERFHPVNIAGAFDGLIFVKETSRAVPLENDQD